MTNFENCNETLIHEVKNLRAVLKKQFNAERGSEIGISKAKSNNTKHYNNKGYHYSFRVFSCLVHNLFTVIFQLGHKRFEQSH